MKRLYFVLLGAWLTSACLAEPEYLHYDWPKNETCDNCMTLKIGHLQIYFPRQTIEKAEILHLDGANAYLTFTKPYQGTTPALSIITIVEPYRLKDGVRKYYPEIGVKTTLELFKKMGNPSSNKRLNDIKMIYNISNAKQYITYSGNQAYAFYVNSNKQGRDELYIIPANIDKFVYKLKGELTKEVVNTVLSHTVPHS